MRLDLNYPLTRYIYRPVSLPVAATLARTAVTPVQLTWLSAALTLAAGAAFAARWYVAGAALALVGSITDCVDGDLARLTNRTSRAGAFLDSVLDRWADAALILGLAVADPQRHAVVAGFALAASVITSYTRARAQSLGVDCPEGIATRDVRMLILVALVPLGLVVPALALVAALGFVTSAQRLRWGLAALERSEGRDRTGD